MDEQIGIRAVLKDFQRNIPLLRQTARDFPKILNQLTNQKQVNLSFDILQELSKEGKISAHDIEQREWIDAESPMILKRNGKLVTKIIKQMGL